MDILIKVVANLSDSELLSFVTKKRILGLEDIKSWILKAQEEE